MRLLVTGGTGKVGRNFLAAILGDPGWREAELVLLCHNRTLEPGTRVKVVRGSLADPAAVAAAMAGTTHVLHLAAVKESPDLAMDVAVKGMFLLLEAFRASPAARQFVLVSGDCVVGHIFQPHDGPITEAAPRKAYPGCYALTKVIEEVMLETYQVQYGIDGCILRAPWLMEKDDFRCALAFGPEQFGGPPWAELLDEVRLRACARGGHVPLMRDAAGAPLRRNFLHVDDLVRAILAVLDNPEARQQLFNVAMDAPVDYAQAAGLLAARHGLKPVEIATPFHSNWLDNARARLRLGWRPEVDLEALIDRAWSYERAADEARRIWYPG